MNVAERAVPVAPIYAFPPSVLVVYALRDDASFAVAVSAETVTVY